jgi:hypothetical protein
VEVLDSGVAASVAAAAANQVAQEWVASIALRLCCGMKAGDTIM